MEHICYVDRKTGLKTIEDVYGGKALRFMYKKGNLRKRLVDLLSKNPLFSACYGWWQKRKWSKKKIRPFISRFNVVTEDFLDPIESFHSFNDFFIRKLKKEARPIHQQAAVIPADGRYRFFPNISLSEGYLVKGKKFNLSKLLENDRLASQYAEGSMVMARLCPTDYHRFHFPCDCIPGPSKLINGFLYSVSPIAVKRNISIFSENKRCLTLLETKNFGNVIFMEIGATNVGSIHQTYTPNTLYKKGEEKGFFSFGGSALILLFKPNTIIFDEDLLKLSESGLEILCLMGQSMGRSV